MSGGRVARMDRPYGLPHALAAPRDTGAKTFASCPLTLVVRSLLTADLRDGEVTPGSAQCTVAQIGEQLEPIVRAGSRTVYPGGDHLIVLGEQVQ
jgi:arginase family enzyme